MGINKRKWEGLPYGFVAIPKQILDSPTWQALPHSARALALDLAAQYSGKNNGRLTPAWPAMQPRGWVSKGTLARAKAALMEAPFVVLTRRGHPPRTAEWIAFTWWPLHWENSMDIGPRGFPYLNFQSIDAARIDPNIGRDQAIKKCISRSRNGTDSSRSDTPDTPVSIPMNRAIRAPSVSKQNHAS